MRVNVKQMYVLMIASAQQGPVKILLKILYFVKDVLILTVSCTNTELI